MSCAWDSGVGGMREREDGDGERAAGEDRSCPDEEEGGGRCESIWDWDCDSVL